VRSRYGGRCERMSCAAQRRRQAHPPPRLIYLMKQPAQKFLEETRDEKVSCQKRRLIQRVVHAARVRVCRCARRARTVCAAR